jgi:branched-chain amino acid transport system ATP-binding protein
MSALALLEVDGVSVRFAGLRALDSVDLRIEDSEIVSLIGPNGAGKTTLLNTICGLVVPSAGDVRFRGRSLRGVALRRLRTFGISRTFQHAKLLDDLTALDNVVLGAHSARTPSGLLGECLRLPFARRETAALAAKAHDLLRQFSLGDVAYTLAGALPFGKKKLVDLARAMISQPTLMLIDEPTAGLNDAEVKHLGHVLAELRSRMSMLIVAHHMGFVADVADRVLCLDGGVKIAEGSAAAVQSNPVVAQAYLGKD